MAGVDEESFVKDWFYRLYKGRVASYVARGEKKISTVS